MANSPVPNTRKRPFQDITDRFVSPQPSKSRRKPKTPGGALGERLRLRVIENTAKLAATPDGFPSSLPPSSPPLYSSSSRGGRVPLLSSEGEVAREMHRADHEELYQYGRDDFASMDDNENEYDEDAENRAPATNSDPFGFFAVERRLKAERAAQPVPAALPRQPPARATDDRERDDGRLMPTTPHKPKPGKRAAATADTVLGPGSEAPSLSSSPSPIKHAEARASPDGSMDTSGELFPARVQTRRRADGDEENAPPRRKKPRRSESPEVALPLPPRRNTCAQSAAQKETQAQKSKSAKDDVKPRSNTRATRKAPPKTKPRAKKKAVKDNDSDDDQQEKFDAERRARVEYFRKLDDYSFEKENVYVV
ncbi:hypothetical protein B0H15DRAFT_944894 [Mycena belliarum]|uniref:Uncharacterized protein n=1 Tax=Mycena belliarum TaxID=1033014 RepID=A0AAD6UE45_9AGAR|nr:hypothetical protein B0H15DRAFT_944894 [Mycena belliae]